VIKVFVFSCMIRIRSEDVYATHRRPHRCCCSCICGQCFNPVQCSLQFGRLRPKVSRARSNLGLRVVLSVYGGVALMSWLGRGTIQKARSRTQMIQ